MCINVWLFLISILAVSICHVLTAMNSFIEQCLEIALTFFTCLGSYFLYPLHLWAVTSFYFCYVGSFMFYQSEFMLACSSSSFSSFLPSFFIFGFIGSQFQLSGAVALACRLAALLCVGFWSPEQESGPRPLHWRADSQPLDHQEVPPDCPRRVFCCQPW